MRELLSKPATIAQGNKFAVLSRSQLSWRQRRRRRRFRRSEAKRRLQSAIVFHLSRSRNESDLCKQFYLV